ncbi:MAG: alpha/beta hydrolase [Devosia sp.]|nr:alpha/beta hydrolase [Devosia sp.]
MDFRTINGIAVAVLETAWPRLISEQDAVDLIGETYGRDVELMVVPVERLAPDFFQLRTGLAGAFIQKFVNYRLRLAIVGDISGSLASSTALRDFVTESNRVRQVTFAPDLATLEATLR